MVTPIQLLKEGGLEKGRKIVRWLLILVALGSGVQLLVNSTTVRTLLRNSSYTLELSGREERTDPFVMNLSISAYSVKVTPHMEGLKATIERESGVNQRPSYEQRLSDQVHKGLPQNSMKPLSFTRGLNLFGPWQSIAGGTNVFANENQLDYYKSKGLTTIRQPLLWDALQPAKFGEFDTAYLGMMDNFVANLKSRGMRVSFTFINQGVYPAESDTAITGTDLADAWIKLAAHYKDEPTVWAYDLMNEPWKDDNWLAHAQQVIKAIRTVDATKLIIVMPQQESSDGYANFNGFADPSNNLWYEAHTYFDRGSNGFYFGTYDEEGAYPMIGVDRAAPFVNWCLQHATVNGQVRCIEGEYGIPGGWTSGDENTTYGSPTTDPRWLTVLDNFLAYLDQNGISGTYWEAGPYGDINSVELTNTGADRPQMAILMNHLGAYDTGLTTRQGP